jgi:tRNA-dihydrouridine synthase B
MFGAAFAVSEMVSSGVQLRYTSKTQRRKDHRGESTPRVVQIVGGDAGMLADAARENVQHGAQLIDINMGCPAKKVCNKAAGSALLENETLVARILRSVVAASEVPVTLKIRTGPDPGNRNGVTIARIAESEGITALAVHGRTRACRFTGEAEYGTIREIKQAISIPVIANGDIAYPQRAAQVLHYTGADAVMIGRAAQGRPWIFEQVQYFLDHGRELADPPLEVQRDALLDHLRELYTFYGEYLGVRVARKHISWYIKSKEGGEQHWRTINRIDDPQQQYQSLAVYFEQQLETLPKAA